MLEFMQDLTRLPEFEETSVDTTRLTDLSASTGYEDLMFGELEAIKLKFKEPDLSWENAFLSIGYSTNPAKVLSKTIMKKPGFLVFKQAYIDDMMGGTDVKIIEDMINKATADDTDVKAWTTKDPMKTKLEIQKYLLENYSGKSDKKKDGVLQGNFFQLIQNNYSNNKESDV